MFNPVSYFIPTPISSAYSLLGGEGDKLVHQKNLFLAAMGITTLVIHRFLDKYMGSKYSAAFNYFIYGGLPQIGSYKYIFTVINNSLKPNGVNAVAKIALGCFLTSRPVIALGKKIISRAASHAFFN
ncbi:MAG: hypothetical protein QRY72_01405 [Candidatus Rhabdochlamydia sp.]